MKGVLTINPLRKKRQSLGFTVAQISDKLGVSDRTINRYETDERLPRISELLDIASVYQLSDEELLEYIHYVNNK